MRLALQPPKLLALKLVIVVVGRCHEEPEAKSMCPRAVELDRIYLLFSSPTPLSVWASDLHGIGTAAAKGKGKDSEIAHALLQGVSAPRGVPVGE